MLAVFRHAPCSVDDDVVYFGNGFSMCIEDREFKWKSLTGEHSEMRPHFVLFSDVYEYNYPTEPDYFDIHEVGAYVSCLEAVAGMLRQELDIAIDDYFEAMAEPPEECYG